MTTVGQLGTEEKVEAAWRWLMQALGGDPMPPVLAVIGLGEGFLLDALERHDTTVKVLALEPNAEHVQMFRSRRNWDSWFNSGRLVYLTDPDYAGSHTAWRLFPEQGGVPPLLLGPSLVLGDSVARASQVLKKILFGVESNATARRAFAPRHLLNSIRNLPGILAGSDVRALAGAYTGVPAVITAAGPSLDGAIQDLAGVQDRALLIATDTSLRPLLSNGIAPSLVVGLDPSALNLRHFLSLPDCRDTWLVADSALDPAATALFHGRTFWFRVANHHPWPWFAEMGLEAGHIDVWGSVLTAAFSIARLAGCDPIVIAGADLAYTGGRPYARGTTYEFDWAAQTACHADAASAWSAQVPSGASPALDIHGQETITTPTLVAFRDWLVANAKQGGSRVINATGAGILAGDGIVQSTLAEAVGLGAPLTPVMSRARRFPNVKPSRVAARVRAVREQLARIQSASSPVQEWIDFTGAGFDPAALSGALDDAAHALETKRRAPAVADVIPWDALERRSDIVNQLPEALARLGAALSGRELPAAGAASPLTGPALLRDALTMLANVKEHAKRAEAVVPGDLSPLGSVPTSSRYSWSPATIGWAAVVFDALLGKAWTPASRGPSQPFFTAQLRPRHGGAALAISHAERMTGVLAEHWSRCAAGSIASGTTRIPLPDKPAYARLLTGRITADAQRLNEKLPSRGLEPVPVTRPRVLTDEGMSRSLVAYSVPAGVVCLTPYTSESFVVHVDGTRESHFAWPRPIIGELPFGEGGAVAWGNGISAWPHTVDGPGYVMYRLHARDEVTIEELSIRPSFGAWWRGRLFFSCLPTPAESWIGVASWVPGEDVRKEIADLTLFGLHPRIEGLELHPCVIRDGGYVRVVASEGRVFFDAARPAEPLALGADGAASSRAEGAGWTATAFPESDLIRLESADGRRMALTCYYPLRLAWIGTSLLVSTLEREVLLFDALADTLADASRPEHS
jgi:hypothetical protein